MHKAESVKENEMYKIVWGFKIETDNRIPTRKSDSVNLQERKNLLSSGFCCYSEPQWEKYLFINQLSYLNFKK